MDLPYSDFLLTSFFNKSPIEMLYQLKYSANANAFSFLLPPGGPTKKILFAKKNLSFFSISKDNVNSRSFKLLRCELTFGL